MKPELEKKLAEKYPTLCSGYFEKGMHSPMVFGFEHEDGWYDLLDRTLGAISKADPAAFLTQVKEKYGELRICAYCNDEAQGVIDAAEHESRTICERCGKPGEVRGKSWIITLCDECNKGE